ncbi:rhodanese-like domain-containing protein [Planctomycetota bacterium]
MTEIPTTRILKPSVSSESVLVIDVRYQEEYSGEHVNGAINIPYTMIAEEIGKYTTDKAQEILLYCRSGARAEIALVTLNDLGYINVENIGGYDQAKAQLE